MGQHGKQDQRTKRAEENQGQRKRDEHREKACIGSDSEGRVDQVELDTDDGANQELAGATGKVSQNDEGR